MYQTKQISLDTISAGNNDRKKFNRQELENLANSIQEHGLAQPITLRPVDGGLEIVAGERRYRAHKILSGERGLEQFQTITAHIRDLDDEAASAIMLAENVGREDLDDIEEAQAYQKRIDEFGWSVEEVANRAGVTTVRVRFRLKLLGLREDIQRLVGDGQLGVGYARIMSEANLDSNRQLIALKRLRDNPRPTQSWFRKECNELLEEQAQEVLFDASIFTVQPTNEDPETFQEPPAPTTASPPKVGKTIQEVISNQIKFWNNAAQQWDNLGKPFKRQECQAAAIALSALI